MCFKQLKIRKLLFVLGMLAIVFASEAQNKKVILNSITSILKNGSEIAPREVDGILFEYNNNGLTISTRIGTLKMSNNLIYKQVSLATVIVYEISDKDSYDGNKYTKRFQYYKEMECSPANPSNGIFDLFVNNDEYTWKEGIMMLSYESDNEEPEVLAESYFWNDAFIQFMNDISNKKQMPKNNNTSTKSSTAPKYGKVELPGYVYERTGYDSVVNEDAKGRLRVETTQTHYIEIGFGQYIVTNLAQTRKYRTNWSTRKGAIKISLPDGVTIGNNDEIICWECNSDPNDPYTDHPSRGAVMFVYSPSTGKLQCVRTYESKWGSRIVENMYYFVTTDASAWSKIKPMLLHNLPFCGNRIN